MYALEVREHIMIAHSLPHEFFGPAQKTHGATFIVDVAFFREKLDPHNVVVDIGRASEALKAVLAPINYANLDEVAEMRGALTTTEFLCRHIFDRMAEATRKGDLGTDAHNLAKIRVTLHESHVARAWFEGPVGA
ncbi:MULTISPECIES: 6-carboxytetrahydropterin synthase [Rhodomicrobium]|uniref:6-pyruvoyl trahydropterin synthase family protein n=1 Tax=Rhodomicrobium TaxID=1068 RepID=UPI000B4B4D31|nr:MULTISPECIES: 6-carboxytetrahydropterin synthase [Rhodomicrobium]